MYVHPNMYVRSTGAMKEYLRAVAISEFLVILQHTKDFI